MKEGPVVVYSTDWKNEERQIIGVQQPDSRPVFKKIRIHSGPEKMAAVVKERDRCQFHPDRPAKVLKVFGSKLLVCTGCIVCLSRALKDGRLKGVTGAKEIEVYLASRLPCP